MKEKNFKAISFTLSLFALVIFCISCSKDQDEQNDVIPVSTILSFNSKIQLEEKANQIINFKKKSRK